MDGSEVEDDNEAVFNASVRVFLFYFVSLAGIHG